LPSKRKALGSLPSSGKKEKEKYHVLEKKKNQKEQKVLVDIGRKDEVERHFKSRLKVN